MGRARPPRGGRGRAGSAGTASSTSRRRRRPRIRLGNDQRRAQLLALGLAAFTERTYDEVSIDDIARAAGISKGLLYHYFPTKRDLYLTGLRATADHLVATTLEAASPDLAPLDRVQAGLDAYLDYVAAHARPFVALMRGGIGSDPEVAAVIESVRATYVARLLENAGDTPLGAVLDSGRPLVRLAIRGWLGFVEAVSIEWLAQPDVDRETVRNVLIDALLATVRIASGAPAPLTG